MYLYKVTVRAIRKRSLKIIVPIVLVLFVFGLFLISDPELNRQEVLNELSTRLNLPQGEADVRTVGSDSIIAKEDAFLQGSKDNYILVSYPGLDILYNQDTGEVVRSRSYAPGSL